MKVITEKVNPLPEPVAAHIEVSMGRFLIFRHIPSKGACRVWDDNSGDAVDWDQEIARGKVLKYYYPGDIITIQV